MGERADVGETKILELEEELRVVANNLKSLEVAEEKANQREKTYKEAREKAEAADATYDEVAKKLATCESELEKAEERALSSLRSPSRNCRRRWTGWRMSWSPSRRSTRPSLRSSSRPSLRCPDTRRCSSNQIRVYCIENMSGD